MPSRQRSSTQACKRARAVEVAPSINTAQSPITSQTRSRQLRSITPPDFWDNLSQVPLCRRALREFNRRKDRPVVPKRITRPVLKTGQLQQIKRFARHGGPSLRDIRGYPVQISENLSTLRSSQLRSIAPGPSMLTSKDPAFEQALTDAGYLGERYHTSKAQNMDESMRERLSERRPSLSPSVFSQDDFLEFQRLNREADTKAFVRGRVFPIIEGKSAIPSGQDELFNNLEKLAAYVADAKPDSYDGCRPEYLHPNVRWNLQKYIIPCSDNSKPLLPNFFVELKADGSGAQLKRQILQDLGNGARGMLKIQFYGKKVTYDGNAYTLGWTYHSSAGVLCMYVMHPIQHANPSGQPWYLRTLVRKFCMDCDYEDFVEGTTWFRNSRDVAKEYREAAIAQANSTIAAKNAVEAVISPETNEVASDEYTQKRKLPARTCRLRKHNATVSSRQGSGS